MSRTMLQSNGRLWTIAADRHAARPAAGSEPAAVRASHEVERPQAAGERRWRPGADLLSHLRSDRARPLRFAVVGGLCGATQLALLALLIARGASPLPANVAAFLLSAQLNFALSTSFTWRDRRLAAAPARGLARRWLGFHGSNAGTALLNQTVFLTARLGVPDLPASGLGLGVAAAVNFLVQDRLIFRRRARPADATRSAGGPPPFRAGNGGNYNSGMTAGHSLPPWDDTKESPSVGRFGRGRHVI